MKPREAFAWMLLAAIGLLVWSHWTTVKTAWKYRDQLGQASDVLDNIETMGIKL